VDGSRRWPLLRRLGYLVAAGAAAAVVWPATPAQAHADLVQASPAAGSGRPQAPGAVVLRFSEPLDYRLSRIDVTDVGGRPAAGRSTRPVSGDDQAMQRPLGLLGAGVYVVRWVSTSRLDGHVLRGSFQFGIAAVPAGQAEVAVGPTAGKGWLGLIGRWLRLAGLLLWLGGTALGGAAVGAGAPAGAVAWLRRLTPVATLVGFGVATVCGDPGVAGIPGVVGPLEILGLLIGDWLDQRIAARPSIDKRAVAAHIEQTLIKLAAPGRDLAIVRAARPASAACTERV